MKAITEADLKKETPWIYHHFKNFTMKIIYLITPEMFQMICSAFCLVVFIHVFPVRLTEVDSLAALRWKECIS